MLEHRPELVCVDFTPTLYSVGKSQRQGEKGLPEGISTAKSRRGLGI